MPNGTKSLLTYWNNTYVRNSAQEAALFWVLLISNGRKNSSKAKCDIKKKRFISKKHGFSYLSFPTWETLQHVFKNKFVQMGSFKYEILY